MQTNEIVNQSAFYGPLNIPKDKLTKGEDYLFLDKGSTFPTLLSTGEIVKWELIEKII